MSVAYVVSTAALMPPVSRTASVGFSFADYASVYPDDNVAPNLPPFLSDETLKRALSEELALFNPHAREGFTSNLIAGHFDAQSAAAVRRRMASLRRGEESPKTFPTCALLQLSCSPCV
jgi:hypothetical protein